MARTKVKVINGFTVRPGANLARVRGDAQAWADKRGVRVFVYRMVCGAHYHSLSSPGDTSNAGQTLVESLLPSPRNKRTPRAVKERIRRQPPQPRQSTRPAKEPMVRIIPRPAKERAQRTPRPAKERVQRPIKDRAPRPLTKAKPKAGRSTAGQMSMFASA